MSRVKRQREYLEKDNRAVVPSSKTDPEYFCKIELPTIITIGDFAPTPLKKLLLKRLNQVLAEDIIPPELEMTYMETHGILTDCCWSTPTGKPLSCTIQKCTEAFRDILAESIAEDEIDLQ